jgi:hypothetical protein
MMEACGLILGATGDLRRRGRTRAVGKSGRPSGSVLGTDHSVLLLLLCCTEPNRMLVAPYAGLRICPFLQSDCQRSERMSSPMSRFASN